MLSRAERARKSPGAVVGARTLATIADREVAIPDPHLLVHLQFRRFAGCPFCVLHLRSIAQRHDEIVGAGVREVVVFHSTADALLEHQAGAAQPFAIVADPHKRLYREFGVEKGLRAVLHPRAWWPALRGLLARGVRGGVDLNGGPTGLPADFLIAPDGEIVAVTYGAHAYDQWSVDELLDRARSYGGRQAGSAATAATAQTRSAGATQRRR